jgi:aldehyde dehydrogenase (NAD+)
MIDVLSASTEEVIGSVPEGTPEDVNTAASSARARFQSWSEISTEERADWLDKIAAGLKERTDQIARTIAMEVGSPMNIATSIQAGLPVLVTSSYAKLLREAKFEQEIGNSLVVREAAGVVGAITPWNYPLHQIMAKVAPALAAGCTVVLKPSELAPLNAMILAEVCVAIGLPPGVLNIVTGYGPVVGEAIASHPSIDVVSFTGSVRAGKRVAALAAETIKKVTLELGGKSACVILDDAPFEKAIVSGARNAMLNSGQTCSAWTRMLVPRARQQEAIDLAAGAVNKLKIGDPLDAETRLGPLISSAQRERVEGYIAKGRSEGAKLVAGGVWSGDPERAMKVARKMRTGQVDVNGGRFNALAPFGGYKQSGVGRELGVFGLEEYLQVKSIAR